MSQHLLRQVGKDEAYVTHFLAFFDFGLYDLPASLKAIATACFWGLPAFTAVAIFLAITALLFPLANGILLS